MTHQQSELESKKIDAMITMHQALTFAEMCLECPGEKRDQDYVNLTIRTIKRAKQCWEDYMRELNAERTR